MSTPENLTVAQRNLRFALMKAIADAIKEELDLERADHTTDLRRMYEDAGIKSMDVKLPGGGKVATISLSIPKPTTTVVDEEALLAWCQANMPTAILEETIPAEPERVIPATPERTVYRVDPAMVDALLKNSRPVDPAGGPVVDEDGVVVDGVTYTPAGSPRSFSVRYETGGREDLAVAWRSGELDALVAGSTLPALEANHAIPMPAPEPHPMTAAEFLEAVDPDYDWGLGSHVPACNPQCDETGHYLEADGEREPLLYEGEGA